MRRSAIWVAFLLLNLFSLFVSARKVVLASGMQQDTEPSAWKPTGPLHREIADSSPVAKEVIEQTSPRPGMAQYKVAIRATVYNLTNHTLTYENPSQFYEVRSSKTGELAKSTPTGCYVNFFRECYTPSATRGVSGFGPIEKVIPAQGSVLILPEDYIDMDYVLDPGEYTVVGIYCSTKREGPECFRSNKITIRIPANDK
jgi:hypothetical protein